jgi:hypothetical protein
VVSAIPLPLSFCAVLSVEVRLVSDLRGATVRFRYKLFDLGKEQKKNRGKEYEEHEEHSGFAYDLRFLGTRRTTKLSQSPRCSWCSSYSFPGFSYFPPFEFSSPLRYPEICTLL